MEDIKDVNKKQERYFAILREWKGFIKVCIDITNEFDEFQEGIKNEYIDFHHHYQSVNDDVKETENDNMNKIEWDNRKYFLNGDEMPYLKYNKKEDMITYDVYVLLDSKMVHKVDSKFNFFDFVRELDEKRVLESVFSFIHVLGSFGDVLALVCRDWNRFEYNWARFLQLW